MTRRSLPTAVIRALGAFVTMVLVAGLTAAVSGAQESGETHPESQDDATTTASFDPSAFVTAAYEGLLGRSPDQDGHDYWVSQIEQGRSPRVVSEFLASTDEHRRHIVRQAYRTYLERDPDRGGLDWYTFVLADTVTAKAVRADLIGSREYYVRQGGGTPEGFVDAAFADILDREPDPDGRSYWVGQVGDGVPRQHIASALLVSAEEATVDPAIDLVEVEPARQTVVHNLDAISVTVDRALVPEASTIVVSIGDRVVPGEVSQGDFEDILVFTFSDFPDPVAPGERARAKVVVLGYDGQTVVRDDYGFHYERPDASLSRGDSGDAVLALQNRLAGLGYWIGPVDGNYGRLTFQAVMAFQKAEGLDRTGVADPVTRERLATADRPQPRSDSGYLFEIDKARQLLILAVDGRAVWVWNTSTGTEEPYYYGGQRYIADTPPGRWDVFREVDGYRESNLGRLYRPKYFHTDGIAVHGYPDVPSYPASHGCVRVTNAAMDWIWENDVMPIGTDVWVY